MPHLFHATLIHDPIDLIVPSGLLGSCAFVVAVLVVYSGFCRFFFALFC
jgi:hypothetical protein